MFDFFEEKRRRLMNSLEVSSSLLSKTGDKMKVARESEDSIIFKARLYSS